MIRKSGYRLSWEIVLKQRGQSQVKNDPVVAIAGVTGAVGAEFIATLDKRRFPVRTC